MKLTKFFGGAGLVEVSCWDPRSLVTHNLLDYRSIPGFPDQTMQHKFQFAIYLHAHWDHVDHNMVMHSNLETDTEIDQASGPGTTLAINDVYGD